jgi:hypothetical protein
VEYFNYSHRAMKNNARCTLEIKSKMAIAKAAFNKNKYF